MPYIYDFSPLFKEVWTHPQYPPRAGGEPHGRSCPIPQKLRSENDQGAQASGPAQPPRTNSDCHALLVRLFQELMESEALCDFDAICSLRAPGHIHLQAAPRFKITPAEVILQQLAALGFI